MPKAYRPPKPRGTPLTPQSYVRRGCNWCREGTRPGPEGICDDCVKSFRRLMEGEGKQWHRYRLAFFSENPWCLDCEAKKLLVQATNIDHVQAWRFFPDLFWEPTNHRGLCHSCHSRKTIREDGGLGRQRKSKQRNDLGG